MAKVIRWACPECEQETHFKGLCRDCTEYDDGGNPVKPIHRVRLNHAPTERHPHIRTKDDFLNSRRPQPSKKQLEKIKDMLNSQSKAHDHECDENCEHDEEDDFQMIGETIGEEE